MTRLLVATGDDLDRSLARVGVEVVAVCSPDSLAQRVMERTVPAADAVVVSSSALSSTLIGACDRHGLRVVARGGGEAGRTSALALRVAWVGDDDLWGVVDAAGAEAPAGWGAEEQRSVRGRIVVVWGPHGAPGRSTLATLVAVELARGGRSVALVDADAHAPSLALALGLGDEGPGLAAACRQVAQGVLDRHELARIAQPVPLSDGRLDVLVGINRPARWPELAAERVAGVLSSCREWVEFTVVDVAASLEGDEELLSDLDSGHRRNAATLASLASADLVVAVGTSDPIGAARLVRGFDDLRSAVAGSPVIVAVNRLRPGALGFDARGQVRRALERFCGVEQAWFLPEDRRVVDAAMLHSSPIAERAPRAPIVQAVRRLAGEAIVPTLRGSGSGSDLGLRGVDSQ